MRLHLVVNSVTLVAFGIALFVSLVIAEKLDDPKEAVRFQVTLSWLANVIGLFVATVAALGLLLRSIVAVNLGQIAVLTLPLLAGLLLIEAHWSLVAALGTLALAILSKDIIGLFTRPGTGNSPASSNH